MNTQDIKNLLIDEIKKSNIKQTGYNCLSGSEYVEIRNALFEVDKPYIFECVKSYNRVSDQWYVDNYEPILNRNNQFAKFINKLGSNPLTRQAIIYMGDSSEYSNGDAVICTMYMHVFLDYVNDNNYKMQYIVHMRSNDAIEFGNDIQWHKKIISKIAKSLTENFNINIIDITITWNADTLHVYRDYFNMILTNMI